MINENQDETKQISKEVISAVHTAVLLPVWCVKKRNLCTRVDMHMMSHSYHMIRINMNSDDTAGFL